jgi:hypothetical protein
MKSIIRGVLVVLFSPLWIPVVGLLVFLIGTYLFMDWVWSSKTWKEVLKEVWQ